MGGAVKETPHELKETVTSATWAPKLPWAHSGLGRTSAPNDSMTSVLPSDAARRVMEQKTSQKAGLEPWRIAGSRAVPRVESDMIKKWTFWQARGHARQLPRGTSGSCGPDPTAAPAVPSGDETTYCSYPDLAQPLCTGHYGVDHVFLGLRPM